MDNIIKLENYRFPISSRVMHEEYGLCEVISSNGGSRTVKYFDVRKQPAVLTSTTVHLGALKPILTNKKFAENKNCFSRYINRN